MGLPGASCLPSTFRVRVLGQLPEPRRLSTVAIRTMPLSLPLPTLLTPCSLPPLSPSRPTPGDLFDGSLLLGDGGSEMWEVKKDNLQLLVEWGSDMDGFDPETQVGVCDRGGERWLNTARRL